MRYNFNGKSRGTICHYKFSDTSGNEVVMDITHDHARALIRQMTKVQRAAEEHAKADQIIFDCAILQRSGVPLGLSSNPAILSEAGKEAAHNRDLRRYLPGGVKSQEQFGHPTITNQRRA